MIVPSSPAFHLHRIVDSLNKRERERERERVKEKYEFRNFDRRMLLRESERIVSQRKKKKLF